MLRSPWLLHSIHRQHSCLTCLAGLVIPMKAKKMPLKQSMPCCMACAPALGVVDAGVDLDLLLPQEFCSGDGAHLLQEEAICIHDQDILGHLHSNTSPDCSRHASLSSLPALLRNSQPMHSMPCSNTRPLQLGQAAHSAAHASVTRAALATSWAGVQQPVQSMLSTACMAHTSCAFSSSLVRSTRLLLWSAVPASL